MVLPRTPAMGVDVCLSTQTSKNSDLEQNKHPRGKKAATILFQLFYPIIPKDHILLRGR